MPVALIPITRENVRSVCELAVDEHQRRLVAPAAYTIAEAQCYEPGGGKDLFLARVRKWPA